MISMRSHYEQNLRIFAGKSNYAGFLNDWKLPEQQRLR